MFTVQSRSQILTFFFQAARVILGDQIPVLVTILVVVNVRRTIVVPAVAAASLVSMASQIAKVGQYSALELPSFKMSSILGSTTEE